MPSFGRKSTAKLETCHKKIQQVCFEVIPFYDFTVICGIRGEEEQNRAFHDGFSGKKWPASLHNAIPPNLSRAVDLAPWHTTQLHVRWRNTQEFVYFAGHIMQAATALGIKLRWGGDWDTDHDLYNESFLDLGHFELVK